MEEIEVNGKKYVLKDDIAKAGICKWVTPESYLDETNIKGIGTMEIVDGYSVTKYNLEYLNELIHAAKNFAYDKKFPTCHIAIKNDYPMAIGRLSKDKKFISGFVLAPVIEND